MAAWQKKDAISLRSVIPLVEPTDCRASSNDFICRLPDNESPNEFDSVEAIADGRLKILTDKSSKTNASNVWSRQPACLLFEVLFLWLNY